MESTRTESLFLVFVSLAKVTHATDGGPSQSCMMIIIVIIMHILYRLPKR
jgi:hypothetical protein